MQPTLKLTDVDYDLLDLPDDIKKSFNMISIKIEQDLVNAIDIHFECFCAKDLARKCLSFGWI